MRKVLIISSLLLLNACIDLYRSPVANHSANSSHEEAMAHYYPAVSQALKPLFALKGVAFPPKKLVYVDIKDENILEVWAKGTGRYHYITAFPILRQSGTLGHKLKQGDEQVPEGIYKLSSLKPNSQYHMGIKVDYPNKLDKIFAQHDKRSRLGGDIYIHGAMQSTGCLSMGNRVAEQLYVLTALTGLENSKIIITPTDFRKNSVSIIAGQPEWQNVLYQHITDTLTKLPHTNQQRPRPLLSYKRFALAGVPKANNPLAPKVLHTQSKPRLATIPTTTAPVAVSTAIPAKPTYTPVAIPSSTITIAPAKIYRPAPPNNNQIPAQSPISQNLDL